MSHNINQSDYINEILDNPEQSYRAAELFHAPRAADVIATNNSTAELRTKTTAVSSTTSHSGLWEVVHKAFLDQHIFLSKSANLQETYNFINEQLVDLSDNYKNFRVFADEFKTVGYFLDETRQGCYRIQCFSLNGELGVNCTRLDGDSLAVCSLWSNLKQRLHEQEFYVDKFLVEDAETEDDDIFGDDESSDEFDMDSFKFLDFSRDEAFVSKMVDDVLDINVGTHALMLLKFNFKKESNLQLVSHKFGQKLFDNTCEKISGPNVSLPVAVCASHILNNMVAQAAVTVTSEQMESIFHAAKKWCSEENPESTVVPTASEEAATLFVELIPHALKRVSGDVDEINAKAEVQLINDKTDFDRTHDAAENFLAEN